MYYIFINNVLYIHYAMYHIFIVFIINQSIYKVELMLSINITINYIMFLNYVFKL